MTALVRAASLTGFAELARALGADPRRLLAEAGLPAVALTDPDLKISADAVGLLLERTAARTGTEDFGLRLAEARRLSNLGPVAMVIREQPTLRQALEVMRQYQWLHNEALDLALEEEGGLAILSLSLAGQASRQATELSLAVLARTFAALLGEAWRPQSIHLRHAAPADAAMHRRAFGRAPFFDQPFDGIVLEAQALDAPIASADPAMAAQARRFADQLATARPRSWTGAARELIVLLLPTGRCSADEAARMMGVDRRTLHRRLAAEGTGFRDLLEACRRDLTASLMARGLPLGRIADLTGFASPSSFSHWRRRSR